MTVIDNILKAIIVDDEYLIRDLLKKAVDWKSISIEIAGEASNANEGLKLIDEIMPDIVFTDIYMPIMDGLEFSRLVLEKYPQIKIVVLTGYDEFEYAQKSVKIGVAEFILKPIDDEEIKKAAIKLRDEIYRNKEQLREFEILKKELDESIPYIKEKLINELVQGRIENSELLEKKDYYLNDLKTEHFQIALLEVFPSDVCIGVEIEKKRRLSIQAMECLKLLAAGLDDIQIFFDSSQRIGIINCSEQIDTVRLCESLKAGFTGNISAGISNVHEGLDRMTNAYNEACNALNYRIISGNNKMIQYCDISYLSGEWNFQNRNIEELGFYIKSGLKEKAYLTIDGIFNEMNETQNITIENIRAVAANIALGLFNILVESDAKGKGVFEINYELYNGIMQIDNIPDMKSYLKQSISKAFAVIDTKTKKVYEFVDEIKKYIVENISNPEISLSSLAKEFYLNPSYLSRIFKQETGLPIVKYITKIRMEKAIELFKNKNFKMYEIAEMTGITDPHYFGLCFKKYTGYSVNDFKKM